MKSAKLPLIALTIVSLLSPFPSSLWAQGSAFTYQGRLTLGGAVALGNWDLQFRLFDAAIGGNQIGSTLTVAPVVINSGLFTVTLDFGATALSGANRWLEVGARTNGSADGYALMFPRAGLTATPYAISAANGVPSGSIMAFGGTNMPPGWILCDGTAHFATNYPNLFAAIGTAWGSGYSNFVKTADFNLPDLRGMFLRGVSGASTNDPDKDSRFAPITGGNTANLVGSFQSAEFEKHTHSYADSTAHGQSGTGVDDYDSGSNDTLYKQDVARTTGVRGGNETRPRNAYVYYIIKY